MSANEKLTEYIIDNEVRLRILERIANDIHKLLRYILVTTIGSIIIPIGLKYFNLM